MSQRISVQGSHQNEVALQLPKTQSVTNKELDVNQVFKSVIDQKEKTISDLKSKLRANDTRTSFGVTFMKSNMMKSDSVLNFRLNENSDVLELKRALLFLVAETQQTHDQLVNRCNKVREMLDLYEARVQFDDMLFLKEKDVQRMNEHIKHLTDSLVHASKNELLYFFFSFSRLNEKLREHARLKHDLAQLRSRNEQLEKGVQQVQAEHKDLKRQLAAMKEEEMLARKQRVQDQNSLQALGRKVEVLERGLEVYVGAQAADVDNKLKNTVSYLVRENQELKKECATRVQLLEAKDKDVRKLLGRIGKLQNARFSSEEESSPKAMVSQVTQSAEYEALERFKNRSLSQQEEQTVDELRERNF